MVLGAAPGEPSAIPSTIAGAASGKRSSTARIEAQTAEENQLVTIEEWEDALGAQMHRVVTPVANLTAGGIPGAGSPRLGPVIHPNDH